MNEEQAIQAVKAFGSDFMKAFSVAADAMSRMAKAQHRIADNLELLARATAGEFDEPQNVTAPGSLSAPS